MENLGEMVCACEMEIEDSGSRPAWAKKKKKKLTRSHLKNKLHACTSWLHRRQR
jgi:hypothetical protein